MMSSKDFYEVNLTKQREIVEQKIEETKNSGDPVIMFPFDIYKKIEEELSEKKWKKHVYYDKVTGKRCAFIYPEEYTIGDYIDAYPVVFK